jgi:hypothetical protein
MPRSKLVLSIVLGAALVFGGCARFHLRKPAEAQALCPRVDLGEVESDCPWAQWVRETESGSKAPADLPEVIARSLDEDARDPALQEAWGMSLNFDSGAKAEIVKRPVLEELARRFGAELVTDAGITRQHAGLIHTYGYLLSNLWTPFGYKRARWVAGTVERGLSLPESTLGPATLDSSTLLSRATYLFMRVALHQDPAAWKVWEARLSGRATPELRALAFGPIQRNKEARLLKNGEKIELVTDLVSLPQDPQGGRLLVYSVRRGARVQLITGFPVDSKFQERPGNPVRPRYNAWVE